MTVTANWALPTRRSDNTVLAVGDIAFTRFTLSRDGGAFTQLVDVPAPTATTTITQDLAPGNYVLRAVVFDRQNPQRTSTPVDVPFVIPVPVVVLAAPRPVTNLTAVVS